MKDFGSYAMVDMSHQTVVRWEVKLAAAVVAAARHFHEQMLEPTSVTRFTVHVFSCDATNTSIWHQAKLHGLFLTSVLMEGDDIDNVGTAPFRDCYRLCWPK